MKEGSTALNQLAKIIEMGIGELCEFLHSLGGEPACLESFLGQAILHFQRGELTELVSLAETAKKTLPDHPEMEEFQCAIALRIAIRKHEFPEPIFLKAEACFAKNTIWSGELAILLGTAFLYRGMHEAAIFWFKRASVLLAESGSVRKAVKARLNVLVTMSHVNQDANLIPGYFDVYRAALKVEEFSVASTCLLNISREYQIMGALKAALKYCSEAARLSEHSFGSLHFYLILAHRAQLFCELKRFAEAQTDFECAMASPFPEVRGALKILEPLLATREHEAAQDQLLPENKLLPTWIERKNILEKTVSFSDLENRLLEFIGNGARDRVEIVEHLYGERLDFEIKVNRFKSLLGNLRRKSPHLLICEEGKYRLSEVIPAAKRALV